MLPIPENLLAECLSSVHQHRTSISRVHATGLFRTCVDLRSRPRIYDFILELVRHPFEHIRGGS